MRSQRELFLSLLRSRSWQKAMELFAAICNRHEPSGRMAGGFREGSLCPPEILPKIDATRGLRSSSLRSLSNPSLVLRSFQSDSILRRVVAHDCANLFSLSAQTAVDSMVSVGEETLANFASSGYSKKTVAPSFAGNTKRKHDSSILLPKRYCPGTKEIWK